MLVEKGFAEDDVRRALNENGCNEFMAVLMLNEHNTNTKAQFESLMVHLD